MKNEDKTENGKAEELEGKGREDLDILGSCAIGYIPALENIK